MSKFLPIFLGFVVGIIGITIGVVLIAYLL